MKGTEFVDLVRARMTESLGRSGKKLSSANEEKLNDIREQLQSGHDTHSEAIRLLGDFIQENGSAADDEAEQGSDNEKGMKVQRAGKQAPAKTAPAKRASKSGGKGKSSNAKKDAGKDDMKGDEAEPAGDDDSDEENASDGDTHDDEEDGETPPPDDEDGNGDDKAEGDAEDETGEMDDGEDKDDAKKPSGKSKSKSKGKNAAAAKESDEDDTDEGSPKSDKPDSSDEPDDPSEPGTDDGDGDDDEPTKGDESDEDDTDEGSPKSDKPKGNAAPAAARKSTSSRATSPLSAEAQEALEYYRKARQDAVDAALRAVGRALGTALTAESLTAYRAMLERASMDEIGRFRDDWQKLAKQELSPRGTPTLDASAPGGVRWSDEPTGKGGRQTQARHPGDPAGMVPAGAQVRGHTPSIGPAAAAQDPSLYTAGRRRSTRR